MTAGKKAARTKKPAAIEVSPQKSGTKANLPTQMAGEVAPRKPMRATRGGKVTTPPPMLGHSENSLSSRLAQLNIENSKMVKEDTIRATSDTLIEQWRAEMSSLDLSTFEISIRARRIGMLLDELLATVCESLEVKPNEMLLLFALRRIGHPYCMRPTDILKLTSVTSGTVTYRIDQLVKQGTAERIPDPADRRGFLIRLTAHGRDLVDKAIRASAHSSDEALAPLVDLPSAMDTFDQLLRVYEAQLENALKRSQST
ncbi:MAG TPA: MarR family transcriptional regulator [Paraburkholderia sp.]|uniref:MarR family winged helix-turn-helix transcriptional regulator n=1 Tax=Paraburkholderia sp. TaxID=1926495 RepID=UPI002B4A994C|nr:MarR family transcriptional regulator [Paraburkholderia sp.]HKR46708.1 MarR family transcriptional regulator [Paraburkholderia sp.]